MDWLSAFVHIGFPAAIAVWALRELRSSNERAYNSLCKLNSQYRETALSVSKSIEDMSNSVKTMNNTVEKMNHVISENTIILREIKVVLFRHGESK